jgi:hypothetical protein
MPCYLVQRRLDVSNYGKEMIMVRMIKKVGDRELAWVMLAVAAVALWSTWGLTS